MRVGVALWPPPELEPELPVGTPTLDELAAARWCAWFAAEQHGEVLEAALANAPRHVLDLPPLLEACAVAGRVQGQTNLMMPVEYEGRNPRVDPWGARSGPTPVSQALTARRLLSGLALRGDLTPEEIGQLVVQHGPEVVRFFQHPDLRYGPAAGHLLTAILDGPPPVLNARRYDPVSPYAVAELVRQMQRDPVLPRPAVAELLDRALLSAHARHPLQPLASTPALQPVLEDPAVVACLDAGTVSRLLRELEREQRLRLLATLAAGHAERARGAAEDPAARAPERARGARRPG